MKKLLWLFLPLFILQSLLTTGQPYPKDSLKLFRDDRIIDLTLSTDYKKLFANKMKNEYQPAAITIRFPDSSVIGESIRIRARGHFRKDQCYMPPILLNFNTLASPKLRSLKRLKLVCGCSGSFEYGQLILKEALAYKIYNLLTDMSLRIRLARVNFKDTKEKMKPYTQYAFLLEDAGAMAERNNCVQVTRPAFGTENTDKEQMTLVALFEYMIGNLDWSVPVYHNIILIRPVTDSLSLPYTIAYDFDHSGLVNADYALPPDGFEISSVRERVYRGFPRTMKELQSAFSIFRQKKESIKKLVRNCDELSSRYKNEVLSYLDDFFSTIENKSDVKSIFIDNARQN
jgi:hypothetical protein